MASRYTGTGLGLLWMLHMIDKKNNKINIWDIYEYKISHIGL
jgi:hypothetical protein